MSDIVFKTFNLAVDAVKGKQIIQTLTVRNLTSELSKNLKKESEVVGKFLTEICKSFHSCSASDKRQHLVSIIYCCQLPSVYDVTVKDLLSGTARHVITFIEQAKNIPDKKLGYLALSSLSDCCSSDISYLAVNTIVKDIASKQVAVIKFALQSISHLVQIDLVPALFTIVEKRLSHDNAEVRIQASVALHSMHRRAPEFIQNSRNHIKKLVSDRSPVVMASAIPYITDLVKVNPSEFADLSPKLIFILKQVVGGNLPITLTRSGICAPWLQINILKLIFIVGIEDKSQLNVFAEILGQLFNRCQMSIRPINFAVSAEATKVVFKFFLSTDKIFQQTVNQLGTFLNSTQQNTLLTGLELLTICSSIDPSLCSTYQETVMKSLQHSDQSIKKQTLILLETLINKDNYKAVLLHMVKELSTKQWENNFVQSLSEKISNLVEKYADDDNWILGTFHTILVAAGNNTSPTVCDKILSRTKKADKTTKEEEIERCLNLDKLSSLHFNIVCLELSEFSPQCEHFDPNVIIAAILKKCASLQKNSDFEENVLNMILGVTKLCAYFEIVPENLFDEITSVVGSLVLSSTVVHQRLKELQLLLGNLAILKEALKKFQEFEFDDDLTFLQEFVEESKEKYKDVIFPQIKKTIVGETKPKDIKLTVDKMPKQIRSTASFLASNIPRSEENVMTKSFLQTEVTQKNQTQKVWGKEGYLGKPPVEQQSVEKSDLSTSLFNRPSTSVSQPTLGEALQNLSVVAKNTSEDQAMLDLMNDMLMTSQSGSDVSNASPFHFTSEDLNKHV